MRPIFPRKSYKSSGLKKTRHYGNFPHTRKTSIIPTKMHQNTPGSIFRPKSPSHNWTGLPKSAPDFYKSPRISGLSWTFLQPIKFTTIEHFWKFLYFTCNSPNVAFNNHRTSVVIKISSQITCTHHKFTSNMQNWQVDSGKDTKKSSSPLLKFHIKMPTGRKEFRLFNLPSDQVQSHFHFHWPSPKNAPWNIEWGPFNSQKWI